MAIQTFTAGQILTAAQMTALQSQAVMTFTTEAARDAALPVPTEGMVAYLTAPTVPTFTGGCLTIYNGTVWVCVSTQSATVTTFQGTSSASYTDLATVGPSVTLVTGTAAMISFGASINAPSGQQCQLSFAVSGATTLAASDTNSTFGGGVTGGLSGSLSRTMVISGLTAGTNTFTLKYSSSGGTANFRNRDISVTGIA
jgi:hypothetical protein